MIVRTLVSLLLALTLLFGVVIGHPAAQEATPSPPTLTDLHDLHELQDAFNAQAGKPRLMLLISPT